MKRVAVIRKIFLPISETFIYEELTKLKRYKPYVFTQKRRFADHFPFPRVTIETKDSRLVKHFRNKKIDLIHARFGTTAVGLLKVKQKSGLPMITSFHGNDNPDNRKLRMKYRNLKRLFRVGDLFTVTNKKMKRSLIRHGCPAKKIVVHHSGIDLQKISFKERSIKNHSELIKILFVGRLVEKKGAHYLIRAFSNVIQNFPNARLTIVGDGELKTQLVQLINELGLNDHVAMLGKRSHKEVIDLMHQSHLFCLPSVTARGGSQEGIPNVLKEAMAAGLPVISTYHAGIPELVKNGKNGYLVREKDSLALSQKMIEVLEDPSSWKQICWNARQKVERDFDVRKQIQHLEDIYDKVIRKFNKKKRSQYMIKGMNIHREDQES